MDFWHFVGGYWWMIFPIMGVAGGMARRWQVMSRQRHLQRLETLRLKSEIKAAELAARGQVVSPTAPVVPAPPSESSRDLLERLFREHDEITARWLDYELDVAKMIAYPAMSDGRQPLTAAFLRANKAADALRPASAEAHLSERQVGEYLDAVGTYAVAFEIAEKDARRLRDSTFTAEERKRLERAQHMLKVAVDESATTAERQTAYRRVREELDGLIDLSDAAVENLEKKVALQLGAPAEAGTSADGAPTPSTSTPGASTDGAVRSDATEAPRSAPSEAPPARPETSARPDPARADPLPHPDR